MVLNEMSLVEWNSIKTAIANCTDIVMMSKLDYSLEAVQRWAKQSKQSLETQNEIAEYRIHLNRKQGQWIEANIPQEGYSNLPNQKDRQEIPTLAQVGIDYHDSPKFRLMASIPEEKVEQFIAETKAKSDELTSRAILSIAMKMRHEAKKEANAEAILPDGVFEVIVIDPPWPYGGAYNPFGHRVESPYYEISIDELTLLEIPSADDCILWLWTTNRFMHEAYHLLESWGFEPKTILTWFKDKIGTGYWLRGETEHCLLAIQGKPTITSNAQSTHLKARATQHSAKPDEFYQLVESLCPGRKLDWFGRKERAEWVIYGDQRL